MKKTSLAIVLAFAVACPSLLSGCADENSPNTWVSRLDDGAKRAAAVKRLGQFFEDTMTKVNGDREDPTVKALLDVIAEPMAKLYAGRTGDDKTRRELLKIISDLHDARTSPALAAAFQDYEAGRNDEEVKNAASCIVAMTKKSVVIDEALEDAVFSLFAKFRPSKSKLAGAYKELHGAILAVKSKRWATKAADLLKVPVDETPDSKLDEILFRQLTAVQLLGELKDPATVPALVGVLLTKEKGDLRATVTSVLLRIGAPAEAALAGALGGADPAWATMQSRWPERSWVPAIAEAATMLGRPLVRAQALAVLATETNVTNKALLAQFAYRFAPNADALAAYKTAVESTDPGAVLAGAARGDARANMLASATYFYDASLVDWLVKLSAPTLKLIAGKKDDPRKEEQLPALMTEADTAIKLMTKEQLASVLPLVTGADAAMFALAGVKGNTMRAKYDAASGALETCNADAECFARIVSDPVETGKPEKVMRAVKAATMTAFFSTPETATKNAQRLAKLLAKQPDPSARLAAVEAIDFLLPKGDGEVAMVLDETIDGELKAGTKNLAHDGMRKVANRLRARL